jgi:hypothetical protein
MLFVPLSIVALNRVAGEDSGVASSLLNTGQQVGGAIGLAALGTVTWSAVSDNVKHHVAQAAAAAKQAGTPLPAKGGAMPASILHQALAFGIARGFLVAAGIAVVALIVTAAMIRLRRSDIAGPAPVSVPDDASGIADGSELEGSLR